MLIALYAVLNVVIATNMRKIGLLFSSYTFGN